MKALIACEESQEVCKAFRTLGHEAYSCDTQEPSGGHPEWHIKGDALEAIKGGMIVAMDGKAHEVGKWDLLIAHPPFPSRLWHLPPYTQIIQPYEYGDGYTKKTCLWLRGLPPLRPTHKVEPICGSWNLVHRSPKQRSKTFPGIARAMAEQWGGIAYEH